MGYQEVRFTQCYIFLYVANTVCSRLCGLGGNILDNNPGAYIHVITDPNDPSYFRSYVGSTAAYIKKKARNGLCRRITQHESMSFREENPSLHYAVWKGRDGQFVIAGRFADNIVGTSKAINLSRILEMWTCCILQSLPKATLDKYSGRAPVAPFFEAKGLNIANPLWGAQEYKPRAIEALKDSPDPQVRAYYLSTKIKGQVGQAAKRRDDQLENALSGGKKTLGCMVSIVTSALGVFRSYWNCLSLRQRFEA